MANIKPTAPETNTDEREETDHLRAEHNTSGLLHVSAVPPELVLKINQSVLVRPSF